MKTDAQAKLQGQNGLKEQESEKSKQGKLVQEIARPRVQFVINRYE